AVALVESFQKVLDAFAGLKPVADVRPAAPFFFGGEHLPGLLFAQVRLINQWPDFFLSQQIPALVHGDLVQPSAEGRSLIEFFQREISLYKNLLRNVLDILAAPQNPASHGKYPVLVAPYELFK